MLPRWGTDYHGLPNTLYGYMMLCFAHIGIISLYWAGTRAGNQTRRMTEFLTTFFSVDRESAYTSIQIWRHTLMHTSRPRPFRDHTSSKIYRWLLHWEKHLPIEHHFTFAETSDSRILNIGLLYLISDLRSALARYLDQLKTDTRLQSNYEAVQAQLDNAVYRVI